MIWENALGVYVIYGCMYVLYVVCMLGVWGVCFAFWAFIWVGGLVCVYSVACVLNDTQHYSSSSVLYTCCSLTGFGLFYLCIFQVERRISSLSHRTAPSKPISTSVVYKSGIMPACTREVLIAHTLVYAFIDRILDPTHTGSGRSSIRIPGQIHLKSPLDCLNHRQEQG